jgi:hypothetical protein
MIYLFTKVQFDELDGIFELLRCRHKKVGREYAQAIQYAKALHGIGIPLLNAFDLISPEHDSEKAVPIGRENIYNISLHTKGAPAKILCRSAVQCLNQLMQQGLPADALSLLNLHNQR